MMKKLRYLLIAFAAMMALNVSAQSLAQAPETQMHSTSSMVGSGSTLPQAVQTGAYTTYETGAPGRAGSVVKRAVDPEDQPDVPTPGDNEDPDSTPIGDGMWAMMLFACAYLISRVVRKRERV